MVKRYKYKRAKNTFLRKKLVSFTGRRGKKKTKVSFYVQQRFRKQPRFELCPLCGKVSSSVNMPNRNDPKVWSDMMCIHCVLVLGKGMKAWREEVKII